MKHLELLAIVALPMLLFSVSCTQKKKASFPASSSTATSSPAVTKKDAGKEYRSITDRTYYTADSALSDVDAFISSFNSDSEAWEYVENMKDIRKELKEIKQFFNRYYYSYLNFKESADEVSSDYAYSEWPLVRKVWKNQYESEGDKLLRKELENIDEESFRSYMINDAEQRCLENYESKGPLGIGYMLSRSSSTEVINISTPREIEGKSGKTTEGVFRVHLEGSLGMGHRVGTVKIRIKGELGITTTGSLQYHSLDYDILERTGSLQ